MHALDREGVRLVYEEAGSGAQTLVLVHCLGGDHSFMARQFEHFRASYRVVSLDLRGHGDSDRKNQQYTIPGFADDVSWLCKQLGITRPILVGHSLGGSIVLELAAHHRELEAAGIVILEGLTVTPPQLLDSFRPFLAGIRTPAFTQVMRQFAAQLFGPHFDPVEKAWRIERMAENSQQLMVSALEGVLSFDSATAAAACEVPVLYLSSGPWYTDVSRFKELCPQLVTAQTVGAGHNFQLEIPEQVNPIIDRFIAVYVRLVARTNSATG